MRTLRAAFMEGDATAAPLMRIAILICEVDRVLAQMDRHDRVGLFTVEPNLHGALDAAKVRRVSSAAERQHKCGGKAEGHRAAKNTGFCSVIFITSVKVSGEECSGENAR